MKQKKIFIATMFLGLMLFFGMTVNAEIHSGNYGTNLTWELNTDTGILNISGNGPMEYYPECPWYDWGHSIKTVNVNEGVTSISNSAFYSDRYTFYNRPNLTTVNIAGSVQNIGANAFFNVSSLTDVNIAEGVTSIGWGAFEGCSALTNINIPNSVTRISGEAFSGCGILTSINIPSSVTEIGDNAFENCSALTNITIPGSVKTIAANLFSNSGLTSVTIQEGVENINDNAFSNCPLLTSITIPESVTSIGTWTFSDCQALTDVKLPSNITSITERMFFGCSSLVNVNIPNSVTSIGNCAFGHCYNLTSINIPDGVTEISDFAFEATALSSINLPKTVTSIGYRAFWGCGNMTDVYYSGAKTDWNAIRIENENESLTNATIHYADGSEGKIPQTSITLTIGKKEATINGATTENDVAPIIRNDRTMLPIRVVAEALGATVDWFGDTRTVKINADNIEISLVIDDNFAMVNGEQVTLDSPSFIENERTYLPLRFVVEKLGAVVEWDGSTQTIYITK